jgi:hypothetical protein
MLQYGIKAQGFNAKPGWARQVVFGPKVSSGNGVRREPILNLRMFLSAKGLLSHVTKLRRSSNRIKPQSMWYLKKDRERDKHLGCWSHKICLGKKRVLYDRWI